MLFVFGCGRNENNNRVKLITGSVLQKFKSTCWEGNSQRKSSKSLLTFVSRLGFMVSV